MKYIHSCKQMKGGEKESFTIFGGQVACSSGYCHKLLHRELKLHMRSDISMRWEEKMAGLTT